MKYEILLNQLRDPIRLSFCRESDAVLIKEAADAIEELRGVIQRQREMINATAYLPLYPKPMKWISVEERLPEENKPVVATYWHENKRYSLIMLLDEFTWFRPTHWFYLPEPPKE